MASHSSIMVSEYTPTNETSNFVKFSLIICHLCRDIVFQVLAKEVPPADLPKKMAAKLHLLGKLKIGPLDPILSKPDGAAPCSEDFSISILYSLLRNICPGLSRPSQGWGCPPKPSDTKVSDDVERIRQKRNDLFRNAYTAALSDSDFKKELAEMKEIISRLDEYLGTSFLSGLNAIERSTVDPDMHIRHVERYRQPMEECKVTRAVLYSVKTELEKGIRFLKDQPLIGAELSQEEAIEKVLQFENELAEMQLKLDQTIEVYCIEELQGHDCLLLESSASFYDKPSSIIASNYIPTTETANFGKFARIILDLCRDAVFQILTLQIPPKDLSFAIKDYLSKLNREEKLKFTSEQLQEVLSKTSGVYPSSIDFDICGMYTLLKNICPNIASPAQGWGYHPEPSETQLSDDIERIRQKRNVLFRNAYTSLSDTIFNNELAEMTQIISRLDKTFGTNFLSGLIAIEGSTVDPAMHKRHAERYQQLCEQLQKTQERLKFIKIKHLEAKYHQQMKKTPPVERYQQVLEQLQKTQERLKFIKIKHLEAKYHQQMKETRPVEEELQAPSPPHLLPPEILRMDSDSIALYKQALEEGKEYVHNIRLMIIGHSGVGKTTLARRLLGDPVDLTDSDPPCTNGIEVHIDRCKVAIADQIWIAVAQDIKTSSIYKRLATMIALRQQRLDDNSECQPTPVAEWDSDHNDYEVIYARQATEYVTETAEPEDSEPTPEREGDWVLDGVQGTLVEDFTTTAELEPVAPGGSNTNISAPANTDINLDAAALNDLKALITEAGKTSTTETAADYADVSVWDFAGHFVFYSTHQMFLSPRAVYLLVTDINKHIGDVVTGDECYFDSAGPKQCPISDFVDFWLNSVYSYTPSVHKGVPPVILVGTHADELTKVGGPDYRQKKSEAYFEAVRRHLSDNPMSSHLADEDFDIDNTAIDPKLETLKKKIFEVASNQPYWDEPVPTKWLPLERALSELKETGLKVIDHATVEELNEGLAVPISRADELELFLRFQHESGNLLYFSDSGLRDKVVLDSQWLVDALKSLITAKMFCVKKPEILKKWDEFFRKGILRKELLDAVWKKETSSSFHDNRDHLLALMEKLNLIAKPKTSAEMDVTCELEDTQRIGLARISSEGDEEQAVKKRNVMKQEEEYYLAPCMLKDPPPECLLNPCSQPGINSTSVLCFSFNRKFLPAAVFHHLIATCLSKWSLWRQGRKDQIFCGCGVFKVDSTHQMTACLKQYVIEIWVTKFGHKDSLPCPETCMVVREFIDACLRHTAGCLPQSPNFEVCIKCPEATFDCLDSNIPVDDLRNEEEIACSRHDDYTHACSSKQLMNYWYPISGGETVESQEREHSGYGDVHRSPAAQARSSELKRETADDTLDADVFSKLDEVGKSVGAIATSNRTIGTVFRVGTKYVMTAWHVVRRILDPDRSGNPELRNLQRASINFGVDNTAIISHTVTCSIPFKDEHLDIAVLELVNPGCAPQPLPLHQTDIAQTNFRRLCFFGYGHPSSHKKQYEQNVPVIPESSGKVQAAQDWLTANKDRMEAALSSQGKPNATLNWGYSGWDDPDKVIVNIFQEHGASGAPGLVYEEADRIKVMAVLTNGLPHCFWDLPAVVRATYPIDCRLEQGAKMSAIFRQITHMAPHLAIDIFSVGL